MTEEQRRALTRNAIMTAYADDPDRLLEWVTNELCFLVGNPPDDIAGKDLMEWIISKTSEAAQYTEYQRQASD